MTEKLESFDKYLTVAGFKNVRIAEVDLFFSDAKKLSANACVQFFNADSIAGIDHLKFAAINALTAFKNKLAISNSIAMETLLYASAQHQIKDSLKQIGISPKSRRVAVLILSETPEQSLMILDSVSGLLHGKRDDSVIEFTDKKIGRTKRFFGISESEIKARNKGKHAEKEALIDLVIEHMALLTAQR